MNKGLYRKIAAGKPGTKKITEQYGEDLVCVRYRYDAESKIKYKTIEIIIDRGVWIHKKRQEKIVAIRTSFDEVEIRNRIKSAGGKWDYFNKVWRIKYGKVKELGLEDRIKKIDD